MTQSPMCYKSEINYYMISVEVSYAENKNRVKLILQHDIYEFQDSSDCKVKKSKMDTLVFKNDYG